MIIQYQRWYGQNPAYRLADTHFSSILSPLSLPLPHLYYTCFRIDHSKENTVAKGSYFLDDQTQRSDLQYVREVMEEPLLTREEELVLTRAWAEDRDEKALHVLIRSYSRLVITAALKFRHYGLPVGDLIQEGNIGLMVAAEKFDPERDVRFSTYAKWWVRSCIQDYILRNWSIVRTGCTSAQKQLFFNLRRLRAQLADVTAENMSPEEKKKIADTLKVSIRDVEDMESRIAAHDLSLSHSLNEDSNDDWVDTILDTSPSPEDETVKEFDANVRHHWIEAAMRKLPIRERAIIHHRHLSDPPTTLEAIGKSLNISKERVRQLEARALRKMRQHLTDNIHDVKEIL